MNNSENMFGKFCYGFLYLAYLGCGIYCYSQYEIKYKFYIVMWWIKMPIIFFYRKLYEKYFLGPLFLIPLSVHIGEALEVTGEEISISRSIVHQQSIVLSWVADVYSAEPIFDFSNVNHHFVNTLARSDLFICENCGALPVHVVSGSNPGPRLRMLEVAKKYNSNRVRGWVKLPSIIESVSVASASKILAAISNNGKVSSRFNFKYLPEKHS